MAEHTPTPWDLVPSTEHHGPYITSDFGSTICDLYTMSHPGEPSTANGGRSAPVHFMAEMAEANARHIVHCVNVHDDLIDAVEAVLHDWHSETGFVAAVRLATGRAWPWDHGEKSLNQLRAALARAKGGEG